MLFTPLPSIPSLYKTTEMCSTDLEATKSNSSKDFITAKASAKAESVSTILWHRSVTVSRPHLTLLQRYVQQKSPPNMMTQCAVCKPKKAVISEGTQVTPPEPIQEVVVPWLVEEPMQAVAQPAQAIFEPIEEPHETAHSLSIMLFTPLLSIPKEHTPRLLAYQLKICVPFELIKRVCACILHSHSLVFLGLGVLLFIHGGVLVALSTHVLIHN
jgi:hypothetical protein